MPGPHREPSWREQRVRYNLQLYCVFVYYMFSDYQACDKLGTHTVDNMLHFFGFEKGFSLGKLCKVFPRDVIFFMLYVCLAPRFLWKNCISKED